MGIIKVGILRIDGFPHIFFSDKYFSLLWPKLSFSYTGVQHLSVECRIIFYPTIAHLKWRFCHFSHGILCSYSRVFF